MNSLEAPETLRLGLRRVELEVWREIGDSANPTFNWLAFERVGAGDTTEVDHGSGGACGIDSSDRRPTQVGLLWWGGASAHILEPIACLRLSLSLLACSPLVCPPPPLTHPPLPQSDLESLQASIASFRQLALNSQARMEALELRILREVQAQARRGGASAVSSV